MRVCCPVWVEALARRSGCLIGPILPFCRKVNKNFCDAADPYPSLTIQSRCVVNLFWLVGRIDVTQRQSDFSVEMYDIAKGYLAQLAEARQAKEGSSQAKSAEFDAVFDQISRISLDALRSPGSARQQQDCERVAAVKSHKYLEILQEAEADFNALPSTGDLLGKARRFLDLFQRYQDVRQRD